jgi:hypothetical protein
LADFGLYLYKAWWLALKSKVITGKTSAGHRPMKKSIRIDIVGVPEG